MKSRLLIILCLFVLACAPQQESIKIGGVFHLTGPGAFWGEGEKNGALLAIEEINAQGGINGVPLELIIEDANTDFKGTTSAFLKLIDIDQVNLIIGPTWFGQVASPIADERKVLMLSPSTGVLPQPSPYFFVLWPTEAQEIETISNYMQQQDVKKIAIVYSINDWSESMKNHLIDQAKDIEIVEQFATNSDETDFRTVITKIKQLDVDAIYTPIAFYPGQGAFTKQAKTLGITIPIYSTLNTENPLLVEAYPEVENTI